MTLQEFRKEKTDIELSEEKLISERDGLMNKLNIQHNIEAKIDLFKETCHKFLSKLNDPKIVTSRVKKDIIKLIIDEVVIDGEKLKIFATIPLPNKIHEREIVKTDLPDTFNAGATLGPINQTKMDRIWTKHKQLNTTLKPKVFVAMSGGVDSSVVAALLQKSGTYEVIGAYMKCWSDEITNHKSQITKGCTGEQDAEDARRVAAKLGIPFYVFDFEKEYREAVYDYMVREYAEGLTPNPDVMCNKEIKFGIFLEKALVLGADYIATGHYVRQEPEFPISPPSLKLRRASNFQFSNKRKLKIAKDSNKDQSYFLWTLTQEQLKHSLFPIGDYTKEEVRKMAKKFGLPTYAKKDSQGLCFIGDIDFRSFMKERLPKREGKVLTVAGKEVGTHEGAEFYTIGQRHGLGTGGRPAKQGEPRPKGAGGIPYYVTGKDVSTNTVTVAEGPYDDALFRTEATLRDVHWISGEAPALPFECDVRIRYRQPLQKARLTSNKLEVKSNNNLHITHNSLLVTFGESQKAVTPGQSAVFYKDDAMLGGGVIV